MFTAFPARSPDPPAATNTRETVSDRTKLGQAAAIETEEFLARRGELTAAGYDLRLPADQIKAALAARPDLPRPLLPIE